MNKVKVILGIDPGQNGGIAVILDNMECSEIVDTVAFKNKTEHDISQIMEEYATSYDCFAIIENVHSMPRQGVSSSFKFGHNFGFLIGLLTAYKIPYIKVSPQVWQRAMHCLSGGDKKVTKAAAQRLWPSYNITYDIADALLIAEYGRLQTY